MRRTMFLAIAAMLFCTVASAQESYSYSSPSARSYTGTHTGSYVRPLLIDWLPRHSEVGRYVVAVNPTMLFDNGLRFDFEYEFPNPGEWLQVGLTGYLAPELKSRYRSSYDYVYDRGYNNRYGSVSGWDGYNRMWGAGLSVLYKKMFDRSGWYFSAGLVFDYFRVGRMEQGYVDYREDGLTFYREGYILDESSYYRPSARFNVGKHFAVSRRCFFDLYAGISLSYSIYKRDEYNYQYYSTMYGFAYRGINAIHGGLRFGVLLWDKKQ